MPAKVDKNPQYGERADPPKQIEFFKKGDCGWWPVSVQSVKADCRKVNDCFQKHIENSEVNELLQKTIIHLGFHIG